MKISITLTVEVDVQNWMDTYGPNGSVREDVKSYVLGQVQGSAAAEEQCITDVVIR